MINCDDSCAFRIILCGMRYLEPFPMNFTGLYFVVYFSEKNLKFNSIIYENKYVKNQHKISRFKDRIPMNK